MAAPCLTASLPATKPLSTQRYHCTAQNELCQAPDCRRCQPRGVQQFPGPAGAGDAAAAGLQPAQRARSPQPGLRVQRGPAARASGSAGQVCSDGADQCLASGTALADIGSRQVMITCLLAPEQAASWQPDCADRHTIMARRDMSRKTSCDVACRVQGTGAGAL